MQSLTSIQACKRVASYSRILLEIPGVLCARHRLTLMRTSFQYFELLLKLLGNTWNPWKYMPSLVKGLVSMLLVFISVPNVIIMFFLCSLPSLTVWHMNSMTLYRDQTCSIRYKEAYAVYLRKNFAGNDTFTNEWYIALKNKRTFFILTKEIRQYMK